jgi:hypothetical protein
MNVVCFFLGDFADAGKSPRRKHTTLCVCVCVCIYSLFPIILNYMVNMCCKIIVDIVLLMKPL